MRQLPRPHKYFSVSAGINLMVSHPPIGIISVESGTKLDKTLRFLGKIETYLSGAISGGLLNPESFFLVNLKRCCFVYLDCTLFPVSSYQKGTSFLKTGRNMKKNQSTMSVKRQFQPPKSQSQISVKDNQAIDRCSFQKRPTEMCIINLKNC